METGGNLLDWNTAQWEVVGLQEEELDIEEICSEHQDTELIVLSKKRDFDTSRRICKAIGGALSVAQDNQITQGMLEVLGSMKTQSQCGMKFYSGFTDQHEEGIWLDANSGKIMKWTNWYRGHPADQEDYDCSQIHVGYKKNIDGFCSEELCPLCNVPVMTAYHLQGICKESYIDRFFVLQSSQQLLGYIQTKMVWTEENERWEIVNLITNQTEAFTNTTYGLPLGTRPWYFTDKTSCREPEPEEGYRKLNFHLKVEQPGMFCCNDGMCIDSELVCDGFTDCSLQEDESQCSSMIKISKKNLDANKELPKTYGIRKNNDLDLFVKTIILDVIEIDEKQSYFFVELYQTIKWYDENIIFTFLKNNSLMNILNENSSKSIRKPYQKFCCYSYDEQPEQEMSRIFVSKKGKPKLLPADSEALSYNETYDGAENPLYFEIYQRVKFSCKFENYENYPFGSDFCQFMTYLPGLENNLTKLISDSLEDLGPTSLGQYNIRWTVRNGKTIFQHHGLIFTMHLSRNLGNIILVTYLPTFLMNLINQATNYISSPEK